MTNPKFEYEFRPDQLKMIQEFHPECQKKYVGPIGGAFTFMFTPTNIGPICRLKCELCQEELNLSENENW